MKSRAEEKIAADPSGGQRAALFPALSEGSKEKRAVSILLACLEQVPELSRSLLQGQGAPLGKTSRLQAWTETGPVAKKGADRPDGRIQSARGQKWIALLEAKIGKAGAREHAVKPTSPRGRSVGANAADYHLKRLRRAPRPSPDIPRQPPEASRWLHWSWSSILTQCRLLTDVAAKSRTTTTAGSSNISSVFLATRVPG